MKPSVSRRLRDWAPTGALAALCYLPLLATHPGQVGADTKSYLYLDPSRLLERAPSMWDPGVGLGTVTHQNIGYLWPMGPWFWGFETLGVPDWVAQRLWLGSILFLAGLGVRYLLRTLGQQGPQIAASMFIYALSPYVLTLGARISALLLPFAGLPWMIALTVKATRERSWIHPAGLALLVPTIGSTNATALLLAGLGPLLWIPFAVFVLREVTVRHALAAVGRIGALCLGTSLWWIAGLYCQGAYGIDVLRFTETARTVAESSTAPELLRGLGYWFFYGEDKLGPWIEPSVPYTQNLVLIGATYLLAILGLVAAGFTRWRHRAYFVALILVGLVVGVGAHPWDDPSLWGRGVRSFLLSDTGLAMRSLPRAVPLLTLGLAVLSGAGIAALGAWTRRLARPLTYGSVVLAVLCLPPLWTGDMVASNLERPESIPSYWEGAAAYLEGRGRDEGGGWATRVLEVPGSDFASYRWGNTVDPITPGLLDRPYAARELIPYGTAHSADLLNALDRQMQEAVLDPDALAPIARFLGVGDVTLRADLQYERYNLPRPRQFWSFLRDVPGLGPPRSFGGSAPNVPDPRAPLQDELELSSPPALEDPPKVAVFAVEDPEPIIRALPADAPVLLAGDAEGLIAAAAAGLLTGRELVQYSASSAGDAEALRRELDRPGSVLVVTDTNRRAARRWSTVHENNGATEQAGEDALRFDAGDNRLPLFPEAGDDSFTVAEHRGGVSVRATAYGNPVTYTPEDRPVNAVDDDPRSAWTVGGFSPADGERIELAYESVRTTDHIVVTQSDRGIQNRWIDEVRLRFDDGESVDVRLDVSSRSAPGQVIRFGSRRFEVLSIEILSTDPGTRDRYDGLSSVGFSDIRLGDDDARVDEVIRLPRDLLDAAGARSSTQPLALVLTRLRTRPTDAVRSDVEVALARSFELPSDRAFTLAGEARLSTRVPDALVDELVGVVAGDGSALRASSSRRLPGDLEARATSAIDGDPTTHWSPGFLGQEDEFVRYRLARAVRFDRLDLTVVNDGRHSVPTRMRIEADGEIVAAFDLPALADQRGRDATTTIPVRIPSVSGRDLTFVIESVREVQTPDWISGDLITMPVGIAELGIDGLSADVPAGRFDSGCRDDLVSLDGEGIAVRVRGTVEDALTGGAMTLAACQSSPIEVSEGSHLVRTAVGHEVGIDVDRLMWSSAAADGRSFPARTETDPEQTAEAPGTRIVSQGRTRAVVEVGPRAGATWLVLGQSLSSGWQARLDGRDLGPPIVVNGYANAWLLPAGTEPVEIELHWTPQRIVDVALWLSASAVLACGVMIAVAWRRRRRAGSGPPSVAAGDQPVPFRPTLLWRSSGTAPSIRATIVATTLFALAVAVVVGPVAGVVVGAGTAIALRSRRGRAVTVLGPAAALAASAAFTLFSQVRNDLPAGFQWPSYFLEVHQLAYAGVALLAVDLVVDRLWTGRWWPRSAAERATGGHG